MFPASRNLHTIPFRGTFQLYLLRNGNLKKAVSSMQTTAQSMSFETVAAAMAAWGRLSHQILANLKGRDGLANTSSSETARQFAVSGRQRRRSLNSHSRPFDQFSRVFDTPRAGSQLHSRSPSTPSSPLPLSHQWSNSRPQRRCQPPRRSSARGTRCTPPASPSAPSHSSSSSSRGRCTSTAPSSARTSWPRSGTRGPRPSTCRATRPRAGTSGTAARCGPSCSCVLPSLAQGCQG
jgi:hypothetical protein